MKRPHAINNRTFPACLENFATTSMIIYGRTSSWDFGKTRTLSSLVSASKTSVHSHPDFLNGLRSADRCAAKALRTSTQRHVSRLAKSIVFLRMDMGIFCLEVTIGPSPGHHILITTWSKAGPRSLFTIKRSRSALLLLRNVQRLKVSALGITWNVHSQDKSRFQMPSEEICSGDCCSKVVKVDIKPTQGLDFPKLISLLSLGKNGIRMLELIIDPGDFKADWNTITGVVYNWSFFYSLPDCVSTISLGGSYLDDYYLEPDLFRDTRQLHWWL
jgi:hypothetical protein